MAVTSGTTSVSLGGSAQLIYTANSRTTILISRVASSSGTSYVGDSGVTSSTGVFVPTNGLTVPDFIGSLYLVTDSAGSGTNSITFVALDETC